VNWNIQTKTGFFATKKETQAVQKSSGILFFLIRRFHLSYLFLSKFSYLFILIYLLYLSILLKKTEELLHVLPKKKILFYYFNFYSHFICNVNALVCHDTYIARQIKFTYLQMFFWYKNLPFGLSSAVHIVTKLRKPMSQFLFKKGIRIPFLLMIEDF